MYWTLTYEVAFYIVVAVWLVFRSFQDVVLFGVSIASIVTALLPKGHVPIALFFLQHWGLFALGLALADFRSRGLTVALPMAVLAVACIGLHERPPAQVVAGVVALAAVIAPWFANKYILASPLRRIGEISYSLYLLHVPVAIYVLGRYINLGEEVPIAQAIAEDFLLLGVCLLAAAIAHRYVELPSISVGRSLAREMAKMTAGRPNTVSAANRP